MKKILSLLVCFMLAVMQGALLFSAVVQPPAMHRMIMLIDVKKDEEVPDTTNIPFTVNLGLLLIDQKENPTIPALVSGSLARNLAARSGLFDEQDEEPVLLEAKEKPVATALTSQLLFSYFKKKLPAVLSAWTFYYNKQADLVLLMPRSIASAVDEQVTTVYGLNLKIKKQKKEAEVLKEYWDVLFEKVSLDALKDKKQGYIEPKGAAQVIKDLFDSPEKANIQWNFIVGGHGSYALTLGEARKGPQEDEDYLSDLDKKAEEAKKSIEILQQAIDEAPEALLKADQDLLDFQSRAADSIAKYGDLNGSYASSVENYKKIIGTIKDYATQALANNPTHIGECNKYIEWAEKEKESILAKMEHKKERLAKIEAAYKGKPDETIVPRTARLCGLSLPHFAGLIKFFNGKEAIEYLTCLKENIEQGLLNDKDIKAQVYGALVSGFVADKEAEILRPLCPKPPKLSPDQQARLSPEEQAPLSPDDKQIILANLRAKGINTAALMYATCYSGDVTQAFMQEVLNGFHTSFFIVSLALGNNVIESFVKDYGVLQTAPGGEPELKLRVNFEQGFKQTELFIAGMDKKNNTEFLANRKAGKAIEQFKAFEKQKDAAQKKYDKAINDFIAKKAEEVSVEDRETLAEKSEAFLALKEKHDDALALESNKFLFAQLDNSAGIILKNVIGGTAFESNIQPVVYMPGVGVFTLSAMDHNVCLLTSSYIKARAFAGEGFDVAGKNLVLAPLHYFPIPLVTNTKEGFAFFSMAAPEYFQGSIGKKPFVEVYFEEIRCEKISRKTMIDALCSYYAKKDPYGRDDYSYKFLIKRLVCCDGVVERVLVEGSADEKTDKSITTIDFVQRVKVLVKKLKARGEVVQEVGKLAVLLQGTREVYKKRYGVAEESASSASSAAAASATARPATDFDIAATTDESGSSSDESDLDDASPRLSSPSAESQGDGASSVAAAPVKFQEEVKKPVVERKFTPEEWTAFQKAANTPTDYRGRIPLHETVYGDYAAWAKEQIKAGANINTLDGRGESPLHRAADEAAVGVAKVLIDAGADVNIKGWNGLGHTPLSLAKHHVKFLYSKEKLAKYRAIIKMLKDAGATE